MLSGLGQAKCLATSVLNGRSGAGIGGIGLEQEAKYSPVEEQVGDVSVGGGGQPGNSHLQN